MNQRNVAASVRARLLNRAREAKQDFNLVLTRYAIERLLYRISISHHADQFLLKGALLFDVWFDIPHRRPEDVEYPAILPEFDAPKLRAYPRYTVVAEKFEALSSLGIANSRMKDYFDLWILARHSDFDGDTLRQAILATFNRRKTALNGQVPFGLTDGFAQDSQKQIQWLAFLGKNQLEAVTLNEVIATLATFMLPVIKAAGCNAGFSARWQAGGPWSPA